MKKYMLIIFSALLVLISCDTSLGLYAQSGSSGKGVKYILKEHQWGETLYIIEGNYISPYPVGSTLYTIDGNYIRKGYYGEIVYTIDGQFVDEGYYGKTKYYIDGNNIREGYFAGRILYVISDKP